MWRRALATSAAATASACAAFEGVGDLLLDIDAPDDWRSAAGAEAGPAPAPPRGDWLQSFADPRLLQLVEEALSENYDIAAAGARLDQARSGARLTGADRWPEINAGFSAERRETEAGAEQQFFAASGAIETYGASLSASWEADLWGRLRAAARAGVLDFAAADADLEDARLSIAGNVAIAWFDLIQARLLAELAEDEVATQERALRLTERRFTAGLAPSLDVRLARSTLASSEANLAQQRNALNNATRVLEVLLGRYPAGELAAPATLPVLPRLNGAGAPGDLLSRRPDLRAAEARVAAAGFRAREARRQMLPRLSLSATYGTSTDTIGDVFDPDAVVSTVLANLTLPLFNAGALDAQADRNRQIAEQRLAEYAAAALLAFREAEDALDAEQWLERQEVARVVAEREALAAEELAEREYARGVGTIFELLDAQQRRINAQSQLIAVRRNRAANRVSLYLAIGGDFRSGSLSEDS